MKPNSSALALPRSRWLDVSDLVKPRIAVLVLFTVAVGSILASQGAPDGLRLLHTLIGTALVACSASALNQVLERDTDALMRRTENRPLPTGRLQIFEVLLIGCGLGVVGLLYLALALPSPLAAVIAAITLTCYVCIYTPLKRLSTLNTLVGAVPGALPPVIGWAAMTGRIDREAMVLFFILFLWQVPHFLAIAWIYREDYGRAGLQMLPVVDPDGKMTARQMVIYALALILVSLMPIFMHAGWLYGCGALGLGLYFLKACLEFRSQPNHEQAKRVMFASLIYLPALLGLLLLVTYLGPVFSAQ